MAPELLQTEFPEPLADVIRTVREKGIWRGELKRRRKDGTSIIVSSRWTLHRTGDREAKDGQDCGDRKAF